MADDEIEFQDFERYFPHTPTALCIKECARLTALRKRSCPGPILDVGCGDGLFAKIAFDGAEVWGIDIDANEGRWAQASRAYSQIILGDVTKAKLPDCFFQTCVANCSLEHVPDIDAALASIYRSLLPGGRAFLFVPNREWASHMLSLTTLRRLGANAASRALQNRIDETFVHRHLYDEEGWRQVMRRSPFELESLEPVLSTGTTVGFEMFLLPSVAGWVNKKLTTRWTNFPMIRKLVARPAYELAKASMKLGSEAPTAEFLIVGRKPEST